TRRLPPPAPSWTFSAQGISAMVASCVLRRCGWWRTLETHQRHRGTPMADNIIGIDLGTTNSEVAALVHGHVHVLASDGEQIMPSVVGLSPDGGLLVGTPARKQYVLYPERTVRSIKRLMGSDQRVAMGEQMYRPPAISAVMLR